MRRSYSASSVLTSGRRLSRYLIHVLISREPGRHLDARIEAELVEDVGHVVVDSALRQIEALGDLAVAHPFRQHLSHLALSLAEVDRAAGADRFGGRCRLLRPRGKQAPRSGDSGENAHSAVGELETRADDE